MFLGMSYRTIGTQIAVTALMLFAANTLSYQNPTVARIFRRNGIKSTPVTGGVAV